MFDAQILGPDAAAFCNPADTFHVPMPLPYEDPEKRKPIDPDPVLLAEENVERPRPERTPPPAHSPDVDMMEDGEEVDLAFGK